MEPDAEVLDSLAAIGVEWREDDGPHAYFRNVRAENAEHGISESDALLRECRAALAPIADAILCGDHIYRPLILKIDALLGGIDCNVCDAGAAGIGYVHAPGCKGEEL